MFAWVQYKKLVFCWSFINLLSCAHAPVSLILKHIIISSNIFLPFLLSDHRRFFLVYWLSNEFQLICGIEIYYLQPQKKKKKTWTPWTFLMDIKQYHSTLHVELKLYYLRCTFGFASINLQILKYGWKSVICSVNKRQNKKLLVFFLKERCIELLFWISLSHFLLALLTYCSFSQLLR